MTRRLDSKIKRWPGYILLYDPISLADVVAFEEALSKIDRKSALSKIQSELLPAILPCVAEWHLDNFPEVVDIKTFPGTPRKDSATLISSLIAEITNIYKGDEDADPNA